jgi:hypothetical protein
MVRVSFILVASALALVSLAGAASAQDVSGPLLTTDSMTLWAHSGGGTRWLSTIMEDPAGTDATVNLAFPGTANTGSCAAFTLMPAQPHDITLNTEADILFNIRFGSGLAANAGTVSTSLLFAGTEIASAEGALDAIANAYEDRNMVGRSSLAVLPAGGELVWSICFEGAGTAYIQVSQSGQWCNLVLPIVGPAPGAASDPFDLDGDGLNDTWEVGQYGDAALHNASSDPDADGLNNSLEQELGTNATNADTDGDGSTDGAEVDQGTDPLDPLSRPAAGPGTGPLGGADNSTGDGNGTDDLSSGDQGKDSPGLPLVLTLLALVAIAVVAGRRDP